jgi:hypothetical protein
MDQDKTDIPRLPTQDVRDIIAPMKVRWVLLRVFLEFSYVGSSEGFSIGKEFIHLDFSFLDPNFLQIRIPIWSVCAAFFNTLERQGYLAFCISKWIIPARTIRITFFLLI